MEEKLLEIVKRNLSKVLEFDPFKNFKGINSNQDFLQIIENDPAFAPFSLDKEKYVTARFGGNMITSLHRKLGDLYEELIITLLSEKFGFDKTYLKYSLEIQIGDIHQIRTTDGRIFLDDLQNEKLQNLVKTCIKKEYNGLAFEVRSCYQIGDSKRIQADIHMALALKAIDIEPIMLVFCENSLKSPIKRLSSIWTLYEGKEAFDFVEKLTEFDLFGFLMSNKDEFDEIISEIFDKF
jgi:hypothetical protein